MQAFALRSEVSRHRHRRGRPRAGRRRSGGIAACAGDRCGGRGPEAWHPADLVPGRFLDRWLLGRGCGRSSPGFIRGDRHDAGKGIRWRPPPRPRHAGPVRSEADGPSRDQGNAIGSRPVGSSSEARRVRPAVSRREAARLAAATGAPSCHALAEINGRNRGAHSRSPAPRPLLALAPCAGPGGIAGALASTLAAAAAAPASRRPPARPRPGRTTSMRGGRQRVAAGASFAGEFSHEADGLGSGRPDGPREAATAPRRAARRGAVAGSGSRRSLVSGRA
jgi:hypothetical protein